jgi:hypothetical protein
MLALEQEHSSAIMTPGGVGWLHSHYVPIRRLVTRVAKRLHTVVGESPETAGGDRRSLVVANHVPSLGYVTYDISEAGLAYLLERSPQNEHDETDMHARAVQDGDHLHKPIGPSPVCAVSWSSRHAETLLPVLVDLANRGITSTVVDLATDVNQCFPAAPHTGIAVLRVPHSIFATDGGVPTHALRAVNSHRSERVGRHKIPVSRLAELASQLLARSAGCTHPSWAAAVKLEKWLDHLLTHLHPGVLLCSNDTSPPGILSVRAAERAGADTIYVQHGARVEGQTAWRAQHCRHIAVMGARDVVTARAWTRPADARTYVVGQPRFDVLARADRAQHRAYLEQTLSSQAGIIPPKIAVWACQPFSEQKLLGQFDVLTEGLRDAGRRWGLVIAPHPAQSPAAFGPLLDATEGIAVGLAAPDVGARGCLAGADALISASSTCGIEAVLLDVPTLELALPAVRTLGLADHRAAQRCRSSQEITIALARIDRTPEAVRVQAAAKQAICQWDGRSAVAVADITATALTERTAAAHRSPAAPGAITATIAMTMPCQPSQAAGERE